MAPASRCINNLGGCVLLRDTDEQAIDGYVREHCTECYEISPDFEFRDVAISLNRPMLMGFDLGGKKILLPCVKRCAGPMLIALDADDGDFEELRRKLRK
jgi:hypothetical protein